MYNTEVVTSTRQYVFGRACIIVSVSDIMYNIYLRLPGHAYKLGAQIARSELLHASRQGKE